MTIPASKSAMLLAGLVAALGWTVAGHALQASAAGTQPLKATLIGTNEVPGPGDPDGTGTATVTIDAVKNQLCYTVMVDKVDGVTMAHIHKAPMGSMGNVVVPLAAPTTGSSEGCVQIKQDIVAAILAAPTDFYINVHSEAHIAGAVRGQLGK